MGSHLSTSQVRQMADEVKQLFDLNIEQDDFGERDSLRYKVLKEIIHENYDLAIEEIKSFYESENPYPGFRDRIERYISHCIDLCHAIQTKRNFQGINSLTRSKRQEIRDKFREHFEELKHYLRKIEKVHRDLRIADARSTIYVVKAIWIAILVLTITYLVSDIFNGVGEMSYKVFTDTISRFVSKILVF